jgi:hypothetical protein
MVCRHVVRAARSCAARDRGASLQWYAGLVYHKSRRGTRSPEGYAKLKLPHLMQAVVVGTVADWLAKRLD